jgi:hypothetical protein
MRKEREGEGEGVRRRRRRREDGEKKKEGMEKELPMMFSDCNWKRKTSINYILLIKLIK